MQSIITKYFGPGNVRGSRVQAKATGGISRFYSWDDSLSSDQNHKNAAENLAKELGWSGRWVAGAYNDKGAEVWVRLWHDGRDQFTVEV